jgi:hypothetical protein
MATREVSPPSIKKGQPGIGCPLERRGGEKAPLLLRKIRATTFRRNIVLLRAANFIPSSNH